LSSAPYWSLDGQLARHIEPSLSAPIRMFDLKEAPRFALGSPDRGICDAPLYRSDEGGPSARVTSSKLKSTLLPP
jgi:hypothetical protein